jgi:hypothetical protein
MVYMTRLYPMRMLDGGVGCVVAEEVAITSAHAARTEIAFLPFFLNTDGTEDMFVIGSSLSI